jgi:S-methyl-5-thioribose-1-phosphate isomerase
LKVNNEWYRTVWLEGRVVYFIDQNFLPFEFRISKAGTYLQCCEVIRSMQVRGAGAIGALAGFAMALAFAEAPENDDLAFIKQARSEIESTRPTARNLFHATERVCSAGLGSLENAFAEAQRIADKDAEDSRKIGETGNTLISDGMGILTHCNAGWLAFVDFGTALAPVYRAHSEGKRIFIYVDETRPRSQGARLTAWELLQEGIPHVVVPDNAGAWLMSRGMIGMVITGADRIAANGDTANKIGTLEKAVAAKFYDIPFYIAAPTSTFDLTCRTGKEIVIEERSQEEVLFQEGPDEKGEMHRIRVASPGSAAMNPAFDVTPAGLITGIITEKGIIHPEKETIEKYSNIDP